MESCLLPSKLKTYLATLLILFDGFASACSATTGVLGPFSLFETVLVALIPICKWRLRTLQIAELILCSTGGGSAYTVGRALSLVRLTIVRRCRIDLLEDSIACGIRLDIKFHVVLTAFHTTHYTYRAVA